MSIMIILVINGVNNMNKSVLITLPEELLNEIDHQRYYIKNNIYCIDSRSKFIKNCIIYFLNNKSYVGKNEIIGER